MKRSKFLSIILAVVAVFCISLCGCNSEKDDWDGVQIFNNSLVQTEKINSGLVNPPTVVCDLATKETYAKLTKCEIKPASVILRLNDKFNVVSLADERLCSFPELYENTLKGKIIPIIYLKNEGDAHKAIELFKKRYDLLDTAVMSDNPSYVKSVRKECIKIGGIVEFNELNDISDTVKLTNENLASVAIIPQRLATKENVFYIQSRFKTVWVRPENTQKQNLYYSINSGAYGIVSEDFESVIETLGEYDDFSSTRMPFVVAHRGLPERYNENSVSGVRAAIAAGATHLELDGYLTRDNRIAMMHDYTIDRTSDGEGVIEDFTFDKLKQFKLDLFEPYEDIPSIDDIFEAMKGTDTLLLFEIKSQKPEIVNALKTALTKHNMWRQVVVITYNMNILEAMARTLPEIPTASLMDISQYAIEDFVLTLRSLNAGTSTSYIGVTPKINEDLRDRGIVGWFWTYDSVPEMLEAARQGYSGLTTNVADKFVSNNSAKYVFVKGDSSVSSAPVVGEEIPLIGVTYNKTEEKIKGKVFFAEDLGNKFAVVASYSEDSKSMPTLYTQTFYISK